MPIDSTRKPWWLEPLSAEAADLATTATGLSGAEAKARLARFGPNLFRERQDKSLLLQYLSRFRNPLVAILIVASAVSAFTGEVTNFLIITGIVLLSVTLDLSRSIELTRLRKNCADRFPFGPPWCATVSHWTLRLPRWCPVTLFCFRQEI